MNKQEIKEFILDKVNKDGPIKSVDLALKLLENTTPKFFNQDDYHASLEELVKEKKIIELEYTSPYMEYRAKAIYFPAKTKFEFRG